MIYILNMSQYEKVNKNYPLHSFVSAFAQQNEHMEAANMNDDKVKDILAQTLLDLLKDCSLEKITVKDIIEQCGIARSTFYRYFPDKYGVVAWFYIRHILEPTKGETNFRRLLMSYIDAIGNNPVFFTRCLAELGQNSLLEVIHTHAINRICLLVTKRTGQPELPTTQLMQIKFFVAGCEYVLFEWMNAGFVESAEEVEKSLLATIPRFLDE